MGDGLDSRRHTPRCQSAAHGALAVANIVLAPTALRTAELDATVELVNEIADYPLAIVPNFVPTVPPAAEIQRLAQMIEGTPVQVAPPIPTALAVGTPENVSPSPQRPRRPNHCRKSP